MSTFVLCCELSKAAPCSGGRGLRPSEMRTQDGALLWCGSVSSLCWGSRSSGACPSEGLGTSCGGSRWDRG